MYVGRCKCGYGDVLDYFPKARRILKEPVVYCPRCGNTQLRISIGDPMDYRLKDENGNRQYKEVDIWVGRKSRKRLEKV